MGSRTRSRPPSVSLCRYDVRVIVRSLASRPVRTDCHTCMTTAHQQMIPRQAPLPATRASRRRPGDLPEPDERRRLREHWGLSTRQVATAFGVTPATVRSWEHGRSAPRGSRKEAYRRFLAGLAQHGDTATHGAVAQHGDTAQPGVAARGADRGWRPTAGVQRPAPCSADGVVPASRHGVAPRPSCPTPPAARWPVRVAAGRVGADPVTPERIRRFRLLCSAAFVWSLALWVILTCPPPL
ncbi:helix-turn-helix domain-containing protein [Streptomyces zaomyceticus]|uniref:helix-turn-helix domain-containing protein n=1 Tax=Streptomyces zaomyceticus TaxID=68286 RepID=UPI00371B1C79